MLDTFQFAVIARSFAISQQIFFVYAIWVALRKPSATYAAALLSICLIAYESHFIFQPESIMFRQFYILNLFLPFSCLVFFRNFSEIVSWKNRLIVFMLILTTSAVVLHLTFDSVQFNILMIMTNALNMGFAAWFGWQGYRDDLLKARKYLRVVFSSGIFVYGIAVMIFTFALQAKVLTDDRMLIRGLEGTIITIVFLGLNGVLILPDAFETIFGVRSSSTQLNVPLAHQLQELNTLESKLKQFIEAEKPYLLPGLTIHQLANKIQVPTHQLRYLLIHHLEFENFSDFINEYRVLHAAALLQVSGRSNEKVFAIALESGFASLAPFNRAFKRRFNLTPSQYRSDKQKQM